ncbi:MAG TPA: hypothetical protein VHW64_07495 [Nocardioides sp.]|jgi:hypothetical protein|uniref:hypothetical protein n=1 Tax=Nocardioides sp. TaxID=35761 RepID=UPI002E338E4D|nr:hypothetical protein [Nocardioides sp.]HEX3930530.1 hypothetical protein [Nocardioides sp.]
MLLATGLRIGDVLVEVAESDVGIAGARREQRRAKDQERLRQTWGRLGGIAMALSDEKQSTKTWATGAVGEEGAWVGQRPESPGSDVEVLTLHVA